MAASSGGNPFYFTLKVTPWICKTKPDSRTSTTENAKLFHEELHSARYQVEKILQQKIPYFRINTVLPFQYTTNVEVTCSVAKREDFEQFVISVNSGKFKDEFTKVCQICGFGFKFDIDPTKNEILSLEVELDKKEIERQKKVVAKTEREPNQERNIGTQSSVTDAVNIHKHFLVSVPSTTSTLVTSVRLACPEIKNLDDRCLHQTRAADIWELHVDVPSEPSYFQYQYVVDIWNKSSVPVFGKLLDSRDKFNSKVYSSDDLPYMLDLLSDDKNYFSGFVKMCSYLISDVTVDNMKERIMMLENFQKRHRIFCMEKTSSVIKQVLASSYVLITTEKCVAFTCFIGNIVKDVSKLGSQNCIDIDTSQKILSICRNCNMDRLPTSCRRLVQKVLEELCKIRFGEKYSVVALIFMTYPFLPLESFPLKEIQKQEAILKGSDENAKMLYSITRLLCQKMEDNPPAKSEKDFLDQLQRHLPLEMQTVIVDYLVKSQIEKEYVESSIKRLVAMYEMYLKIACKEGNMSDIIAHFELLRQKPYADDDEISSLFEPSFLHCLQNFDIKLTDDCIKPVGRVCKSERVFKSLEMKDKLLAVLTRSRNIDIHFLFIQCLNLDGKCDDVDAKRQAQLAYDWFDTGVEYHCERNQKDKTVFVKKVYSYLGDLLSVKTLTKTSEFQTHMIEKAYSILHSLDLLDTINSIQKIEELPDVGIEDVFKLHVQRHLKESFAAGAIHIPDLVMRICGKTLKKIRISSKPSLATWTSLIENTGLKESSKREEAFLIILDTRVLWIAIFNAEGKKKHDIWNHSLSKYALEVIRSTMDSILHKKITSAFFQKIRKRFDDCLEVWSVLEEPIKLNTSTWKSLQRCIEARLQETKQLSSLIHTIKGKLNDPEMRDAMTHCKMMIDEYRNNIANGEIQILDIEKVTFTNTTLQTVFQQSRFVFRLENSVVFWNLIKDHIQIIDKTEEKEEAKVSETDDDDMYISQLFYEGTHAEENAVEIFSSDETKKLNLVYKIVSCVGKKGGKLYRDFWFPLLCGEDQPLCTVAELFIGSDFQFEINNAKDFCSCQMDSEMELSLQKFFGYEDNKRNLDILEKAIKAFKIDCHKDKLFYDAKLAYEKLREHKLEELTLRNIREPLTMVEKVSSLMSDQVKDILDQVGHASVLIEFLRSVADDDLRNLIDAVEEHSEQYVRESTVSDLINVKRFFQPLLRKDFSTNVSDFLQSVKRSVENSGVRKVSEKIDECVRNLHGLKALYKHVANRGERTKEIVENVVVRGRFRFSLKDHSCDVTVEYKQDKKTSSHGLVSLGDLRSRALLLMNSEDRKTSNEKMLPTTSKKDALEKFVEIVDTALEISSVVVKLKMSGHFKFSKFDSKCAVGEKLIEARNTLVEEYDNWQQHLKRARDEFYLMNFIHGDQLQLLFDYFKNGSNENMVRHILKFIHPDITDFQIIRQSDSDLDTQNPENILQSIGRSIHRLCQDLPPIERKFLMTNELKNPSEVVHFGRPYLVSLDSQSRLVVGTLLALYLNTTGNLPEAHQILFCNSFTTFEEVKLIIRRCIGDLNGNLFCVSNIEKLHDDEQFKLAFELQQLPKGNYRLAIICKGGEHHPFVDQFSELVMHPRALTPHQLRECFKSMWPNVCIITSDVPGLGKSDHINWVSRLKGMGTATLHVSGPVKKMGIVQKLLNIKIKPFDILHIDIGVVNDSFVLDEILFELIATGFLSSGTASFFLPTNYVYIEIGNSMGNILRNSMTNVTCFNRQHLEWDDYKSMKISAERCSPVQVVCTYLKSFKENTIDKKDIYFNGPHKIDVLSPDECRSLLKLYFSTSADLSYSIVNTFLGVLSDQLKKLSTSFFFRTQNLQDLKVKSELMAALIAMSKDFSSRSILSCRSTQTAALISDEVKKDETTLTSAEELAKRVDGMIRWEDSNHLMVLFHDDMNTISALYRMKSAVPLQIKTLFESQLDRKLEEFSVKSQNELIRILMKLTRPHHKQQLDITSLTKNYALTPDNLLKMVLMFLRIKAHVPVVIMGETGCGKTSLVRYLASVCGSNFEVLSLHAGVREETIVRQIKDCDNKARQFSHETTWLFLDEINTCDHLGLLADIICHHKCLGESLAANIVFIGACNPYRLRSVDSIHTAGLQTKIKTDELSRLVYRVHPLPEMMVDFVFDFGTLSDNDEAKYVERMVQDVMPEEYWTQLIVCLITESQRFIRKNDQTCSVSLRDVERCKKLIIWFMNTFKTKISVRGGLFSDLRARSIIMALAVCYQSRFADGGKRKEYRDVIATVFRSDTHYLTVISSGTCIKDVIEKEQDDIIDRMELPQGIARNTALRENIFVILVCILNKIPVFVVGKPGCSKSLSMQLIRSNLRGKDSKDLFFKTLPQLYCVSFQGSESSTSDGIIKVFDKAKKYQEHNNEEDVMSVVILDEIGLAEISRFNPLKVLHSLLEPENKTCPDVAVVGISNWALDAAKMNRAIHLSRPEMDSDELFETSRSISLSLKKQSQSYGDHMPFLILRQLSAVCYLSQDEDKLLRGLAEAYFQYSKEQTFKNFHGLRDFYSLTKHISKGLLKAGTDIEEHKVCEIVLRGIRRNLSGLPTEMAKVEKTFMDKMNLKINDSTSVLDLIKDSLADKHARHLMLITSGNAVIGVLEAMLKEMEKHYIVILGSQFEDDQTDEYHYRILSRIILCMEQGFCLILKDLDNIYGSLYDMLNQNYTTVGQKRNCRVALGPYSNPMCHVHDNFKCIVIVEETKLDLTDPPFLNRFEKQTFLYADMLDSNCTAVIGRLNTFVTESCLTKKQFQPSDTFPLYTEDLIPSLVIAEKMNPEFKENMFGSCCSRLLWISTPDAILRMPTTLVWNKNAMHVRKLQNEYFSLPIHNGLEDLLTYVTEREDKLSKVLTSSKTKGVDPMDEQDYCYGDEIVSESNDEMTQQEHEEQYSSICESIEDSNDHTFPNKEERNYVSLVAVYTHSNIHTNVHEICNVYSMQNEKLGSFRSEKTLYLKLRDFFDSQKTLLTIQCSFARDSQHILMAKTMIEEQKHNFEALTGNSFKIVCIIFHIEHDESEIATVPQMDFLSGWRICMLDTIQKPVKSITSMQEQTVHNILSERKPLHSHISEHLFWAFSRIKYSGSGHSIQRMMRLIETIKSSQNVLRILEDFILEWILNRPATEEKPNWLVNIACDKRRLLNGGSFNRTIETYLSDMIKVPLAMVFFRLEEANALDFLFVNDSRSSERFITWSALLKNKDLVNIEDTHEPSGPECYTCESPLLNAKLPFSYTIIQRTEKHKNEYLETVSRLKIACEIEDEELPISIFVDLLTKYKDIIHIDVAEISSLAYTDSEEDYTSDFWKYISLNHCKSIKDVDKIQILKWLSTFFIETTNDELIERIAKLHLTHWTYGSTLLNVLTLFELLQLFKETSASEFIEMVQNVILQKQNGLGNVEEDKEQLQNEDSQSLMEQNTEMYKECIVESICEILLPTESTMKELGSVKKWQTTANCILPYLGSLSLNPNWIHCLRFCSDLACNLFIRFDIQEGPFVVIGELLGTKGGILDESEICETVYSLLYRLRVEKPEIKIQLQKVLTIYVHRCLAANENSNILHLVIDCIGKDKFIDFDCAFMGPIFSYAFDIEESENEDFLVEILESTNEYVQCHPLFQSIDCSLKLLQEKGVPEPPLASLFVEVMQRKFNNIVNESNVSKFDSTSSTHAHLLTSAVDIVKSSSTLSVRVVAAIALIRQFIVSVVSLLKRTGFNTTSYLILMQQLDAVFTPKIDADKLNKHRTQCLVIYFLKSIREIEGTLSCQKRCTTLMKSMTSLKDYVLSSTALSESPFLNPFQSQIVEYGTIEKSLLEIEEKKTESLQRFLSDARVDRNKLLCLFNLFAEKIFFRNIIEQVPDTERDVAKKVLSMASSVNLISTHLNAMRFLSLESDFCHKMFAVNTESETHVVQIVSVLVHLMCNILTFGKTGNIWYDWLSDEMAIVDRRLPGLTYTEKNISYPGSPFLCICGIRFISFDNMCPQCGSEQKSDNLGNATSSISAPTLSWFSNELHFQIGYFFARGVQICSYALGVCMDPKCAALGTKIGADTDTHDFLQEEINATWSQLKKNLQMSDEDLSSFLRLLVLKFQETKCHDESIFSCKYASDDIYKVEKEMDKVLKELIPNRFKQIALFHRKFYQMIKDNNRGLLTQLDESVLIDTVHEKQLLLPSLFKVNGVPSFQGLLTEVRMCKTGHPFLSMVLRDMELLNLPQYILPLLQWHKVSVAIGSFKVRRVECSEITVRKFISMEPVDSRRRLLKRSFEEFAAAWQKSRKCFELIKDQLNSQYMDLPLITNNTKLENCLMINENSTFEAVLNLLVQVQNEFLDRCLSLACKEECTCLQFLHSPSAVGSSKILSVPLNEATPGDIIVFEWDDDMLDFSQCNTNEGSGKQIVYDLEKIEREVAHSIVQGKRFLNCSIGTGKIIFIDELFQNSAQLLHDIKQVIPQEPLKSDTIKAVMTKKEEDNTFIEALLTQVGMVLSIMKKVGGDATESLVDYLERWKDIMSPKSYINLLPEPRSSIKLCHVVALFQYLEELSGDSILESLDDRYRSDLPIEGKMMLENIGNAHLKHIGKLGQSLKIFLHRSMTFSERAIKLEQPLSDYLMDPKLWPEGSFLGESIVAEEKGKMIQMPLRDVVHITVLVEHIYGTISYIQEFIEIQKQQDQRISSVVASFKSHNKEQKQNQKSKVAKKRFGKT